MSFHTRENGGSPEERLRITSGGKLLIGQTSGAALYANGLFQVSATDGTASISVTRWSDNASSPYINLGKSRGAVGTYTTVIADDRLGQINFTGADGTDLASPAAGIAAYVDGLVGVNSMPGRLVFFTASDNGAAETERLRITSGGDVGIGTINPIGVDAVSGNDAVLAVGILTAQQITAQQIYGPVTGALTPTGVINIESYIQHTEDTNTRFGFPDAGDTIEFDTAGSTRMTIDSDGRLLMNGITAVDDYMLQMEGAGGTGKVPAILFKNGTAATDEIIGGWTAYNSGNQVASILAHEESANDDAYIAFKTRKTGGSTADFTEKLRITSGGDVGIATITPRAKFDVRPGGHSGDGAIIFTHNIGEVGSDNNCIEAINSAGSALQPLGYRATEHIFATQATERLRITSDGYLKLAGTIDGSDNKLGRFLMPSHDSSEEDVMYMQFQQEDTFNQLEFGGGSADYNAATRIIFRTAAVDTVTGVERLRITSAGDVGIGTDNPTGINSITGNTATLAVGTIAANTISATDFLGTLKGTIHNDVSTFSLSTNITDILGRSNNQLSAQDAGSDKLVFWDDDANENAGELTYATVSDGLSFNGTTLKGSTYTLPGSGTDSTDFGNGSTTLTLTQAGSGTETDAITITAGSNIKINKTGDDFGGGFTISSKNTEGPNTTYTLETSGADTNLGATPSVAGNIKWILTDNGASDVGSVQLNAGTNVSFSAISGTDTNDASITINSAGSVNTTYTLPVFSETVEGTTTQGIKLTPDSGTTSTVKVLGTGGIQISGNASDGTLTIDGSDAAGTSYSLAGGGVDSTETVTGIGTITLKADGTAQNNVAVTAGNNVTITNTGPNGFTINADQGSFAADAFKTFAVSGGDVAQSDVVADKGDDTLTLVGAGGMTITTDADNDKITFNSSNSNTEYGYKCHQDQGQGVKLRLSTPPTGENQVHQDIEIAGATGEIDVTRNSDNQLTISVSSSFSAGKPLSAVGNRFDVLAWTHANGQTFVGDELFFYTSDTSNNSDTSPNAQIEYLTGSGGYFRFDHSILPKSSGAYNLGSSNSRWDNLYINDLQLSNESRKDTGGNDVDGTWGDWTLQEGEENIYMINNRTGKKYAMMLREVE